MDTRPDQIADIETELESTSRIFPILLWAAIGYLLLLVFDMYTELNGAGTIKIGMYVGFSVFLLVPATGIWLLKLKKKAGWIVCLCYFEFMTVMLSNHLAQRFINGHYPGYNGLPDARTMALFGLDAMIVILLLSGDIRKLLQITQKILVLTLLISTTLSLGVIVLLMKR